MRALIIIVLLCAATSARAEVIGYLVSYETFFDKDGKQAWKCLYNLAENNATAERRTVIRSEMCPWALMFR